MICIRIGKARLHIDVQGCIHCGSEYSTGWSEGKEIEVRVDNRKPIKVRVPMCAECRKGIQTEVK